MRVRRILTAALTALAVGAPLAAARAETALELVARDDALAVPSAQVQAWVSQPAGSDRWQVDMALTGTAAEGLAELTANHVGDPMEVRLCGETKVTAIIQQALLGGRLQLGGDLYRTQALGIAWRASQGDCAPTVYIDEDLLVPPPSQDGNTRRGRGG